VNPTLYLTQHRGFGVFDTGGGSLALRWALEGEFELLVTNGEGDGLPDDSTDLRIGLYDSRGEMLGSERGDLATVVHFFEFASRELLGEHEVDG